MEETPTPVPQKETASFRGVDGLDIWISCRTLGIWMLGGLLRFIVEETVREETEGVSMSATTEESMGIAVWGRGGEREKEAEALTAINHGK